jgi:hypothetical protein
MFSVALSDMSKLKPAIAWLNDNERYYYDDYYDRTTSGFTRYYSDAIAFAKRIKECPDIKWGYQIHSIPDNGRERTTMYILFADKEFALAFKLMGF